MSKRFFQLLWFLAAPLTAQTLVPPREYRSPLDSEGFLLPLRPTTPADTAGDSQLTLTITALNKRGFLHRARREAEPLDAEPQELQESARVYSPSQSFIALQEEQAVLMILHPQTSVAMDPEPDGWRYALTGDRGMVRVSTHQRRVQITLKPGDPQSPWQGHRLSVDAGSDFYLRYDSAHIILYLLRGHLVYRIDPFVPLLSQRDPGLLFDWEQRQIERKSKSPYAIELFTGQELTLDPGIGYQIGLPNAEIWQAPILRSSPQLADASDSSKLREALKSLRAQWLQLWQDPAEAAQLVQQGRFEEAFSKTESESLRILCLYRLQQEAAADKRLKALPADHPDRPLLQDESIRARLRLNAHQDVKPPPDLVHQQIPAETLYLLAGSEQQQERYRSALDLWERWPASITDKDLQQSYREWQRHLDQKKPMNWQGSAELGWTDNALHLPSGTAAPAELGHRSSYYVRTTHQIDYLLERSDDFSVFLEPILDLKVYQHSGLTDLTRIESGLGLPLSLQLPWEQHRLRLKPYFYRLIAGSGMGLDRFGYDLSWSTPYGSWRPEFYFQQDQNLDFAPNEDHRLDALSGEPTGAMDRSVRRNTLGVRAAFWSAAWQSWDYRATEAQVDDRQRLAITAHYQRDFPYDLRMRAQGALHLDTFAKERSSVTAIQLQARVSWMGWLHLHPYLALDRDMRQSGDKVQTFAEMQWMLGADDRW